MTKWHLLTALWLCLFVFYIIIPVANYGKSTSRNVTVSLVAQPFVESEKLVYRWEGDVYRSCSITVRRRIIDSNGVATDLIAKTFGPIGHSGLRFTSYEVSIAVPRHIAEGPATYHATEIPECNWLQRMFPVEHPYPVLEFTVTR